MNRFKFSTRFRLALIIVIIVPITVLVGIAYFNIYQLRLNHAMHIIIENQTHNFLISENALADNLMYNDLLNDTLSGKINTDGINELLEYTVTEDPHIEGLNYYNPSNNQFRSAGKIDIDKEYLLNIVDENQRISFDGEYIHIISKNQTGILMKTIQVKDIFKFENSSEYFNLLYYGNQMVYGGEDNSQYPEELSDLEELRNDYFVVGIESDEFNLKEALLIDKNLVFHKYQDVIKTNILLSLSALILFIVIIILYTRRKTKVFYEIKLALSQLLKGNFDERLKEKGSREFVEITKAFNEMAALIESRMEEQSSRLNELVEKNEEIKLETEALTKSIQETDKKNKELHFLENKNEILIDKFNRIIIRYNEKHKITYMNHYAMSKLGIKDYSSKTIDELLFRYNELKQTSNLIQFLLKYEMNRIEMVFLNQERNALETMLISTRVLETGDGGKEVQIVGKDISIDYILEENLRKKNTDFEILDNINFEIKEYPNIQEYYEMIVDRVFKIVESLEVSIRKVDGDYLNTRNKVSTIDDYCKTDKVRIKDSIFEEVINTRKAKTIYKNQLSLTNFNELYEMQWIAGMVKVVYLIPLIIDDQVNEIAMIIREEICNQKEMEMIVAIMNHLNLAVQRVNLINSLKESGIQTIRILTSTIEAKDEYTVGHSSRVAELSKYFAEKMGYNNEKLEEIYLAGLLHDIGKLGIDDRILRKENELTEEEYDKIKEHPLIGYKILKNAAFNKDILDATLYHHKRYDLKGFPDIEVEDIGEMASIIGVSDTLDAIVTSRAYSNGKDMSFALEEIKRNSGTQFNPKIVDIVVEEVLNNLAYFEELFENGGNNELSGTLPKV